MIGWLEEPEVEKLFVHLLETLGHESDRGVVLIGTAHVDNCLESLYEAVFPLALNKQHRKRLLRYPGQLSSFAARIELSYALRLLPRSVYDALQALREIRNKVAHSPDSFELRGQEAHIDRICALGPELPAGIRGLAVEMLLDYKSDVLMEEATKTAERQPDLGLLIGSKKQAYAFMSENPEVVEALRQQLPQWQMVIGISVLCFSIIIGRNKIAQLVKGDIVLSTLQSSGGQTT